MLLCGDAYDLRLRVVRVNPGPGVEGNDEAANWFEVDCEAQHGSSGGSMLASGAFTHREWVRQEGYLGSGMNNTGPPHAEGGDDQAKGVGVRSAFVVGCEGDEDRLEVDVLMFGSFDDALG